MKNSQKGFLKAFIIIICAIFILGLIAIVVLYVSTRQSLDQARQNAPQTAARVTQWQTYIGTGFSVQYPDNRTAQTDDTNANYTIVEFTAPNQLNNILEVITYKNGVTTLKAETDKINTMYGPTAKYGGPIQTSNVVLAGTAGTRVDYKTSGIDNSQVFLQTSKALYGLRGVGVSDSEFQTFYSSFKVAAN